MGAGWLEVTVELTATDDQLRFWIDSAMDFNDQITNEPSGSHFPAPRNT